MKLSGKAERLGANYSYAMAPLFQVTGRSGIEVRLCPFSTKRPFRNSRRLLLEKSGVT